MPKRKVKSKAKLANTVPQANYKKVLSVLDQKTKLLNQLGRVNDSLYSSSLEIGTTQDKLEMLNEFRYMYISVDEARSIYAAGDILQNIIDQPALDATKEWITVATTIDKEHEWVSKYIMDRLDQLDAKKICTNYLKMRRLYPYGAFVLYHIDEIGSAFESEQLKLENIRKIEGINAVGDHEFDLVFNYEDIRSLNYNKLEYLSFGGTYFHGSRFNWSNIKYFPRDKMGVSMLHRVLTPIRGIMVCGWSIASMMLETQFKIWKLKDFELTDESGQLIKGYNQLLTTQKSIFLNTESDFIKNQYQAAGVEEGERVLYNYLSAASIMPQSKIKGQSQGTLTSADVDEKRYYDGVKATEQPVIEKMLNRLITYIIWEKEGLIYKNFGSKVEDMQFTITFNPMYQEDPKEKEQFMGLKQERLLRALEKGIVSKEYIQSEVYPDMQKIEEVGSGAQEKSTANNPPPTNNYSNFANEMFYQNMIRGQGQIKV